MSIEARTREDAENQAAYNGLLVESCELTKKKPPPPTIEYQTPAPRRPMHPSEPPEYRGLVVGAKVLGILAFIANVVGWVGVIMGAAAILVTLVRDPGPPDQLWIGHVMLLCGLASFVGGAMLNWQASLGLAVRDLARNSFKHHREARASSPPHARADQEPKEVSRVQPFPLHAEVSEKLGY